MAIHQKACVRIQQGPAPNAFAAQQRFDAVRQRAWAHVQAFDEQQQQIPPPQQQQQQQPPPPPPLQQQQQQVQRAPSPAPAVPGRAPSPAAAANAPAPSRSSSKDSGTPSGGRPPPRAQPLQQAQPPQQPPPPQYAPAAAATPPQQRPQPRAPPPPPIAIPNDQSPESVPSYQPGSSDDIESSPDFIRTFHRPEQDEEGGDQYDEYEEGEDNYPPSHQASSYPPSHTSYPPSTYAPSESAWGAASEEGDLLEEVDDDESSSQWGGDRRAHSTGAYPDLDEMGSEEVLGEPKEMAPCEICGRSFAIDRLAKHAKICAKAEKQGKKRKVFGASAERLKNVERSMEEEAKLKAEKANKKAAWKAQHEQFQNALKSAAAAKNGEPPPADLHEVEDDRVPCPHCGRKFAAMAAERHIPHCLKTRAKPNPVGSTPKRPSGKQTPTHADAEYATDKASNGPSTPHPPSQQRSEKRPPMIEKQPSTKSDEGGKVARPTATKAGTPTKGGGGGTPVKKPPPGAASPTKGTAAKKAGGGSPAKRPVATPPKAAAKAH